jgi:hypothetical protein
MIDQRITNEQLAHAARTAIERLDGAYWDLGEYLQEMKARGMHRLGGFQYFGDFVERELRISRTKARRIAAVTRSFQPYRETVEDCGWSTLAEAIPLLKHIGPTETLHIVLQGYEAVKAWKVTRKSELRTDGYKIVTLRLPVDIAEHLERVIELVSQVSKHNGATVETRASAFAAILIEAESGFLGQMPSSPDRHADATVPRENVQI